jgi:hypothetical protein
MKKNLPGENVCAIIVVEHMFCQRKCYESS